MDNNDCKVFTTTVKPLTEERETHISIYQNDNGDWIAELETCIQKYDNKCRRQGWTQKSVIYHADGSWVSSVWSAPASAVTIGKAVKVKRAMSDEQKQAASERLAKAREMKDKN